MGASRQMTRVKARYALAIDTSPHMARAKTRPVLTFLSSRLVRVCHLPRLQSHVMLENLRCTSQRSVSGSLDPVKKPAPAECLEGITSVEEQVPFSRQLEPGANIRIEEIREACAASNHQCDSLCHEYVCRTLCSGAFRAYTTCRYEIKTL